MADRKQAANGLPGLVAAVCMVFVHAPRSRTVENHERCRESPACSSTSAFPVDKRLPAWNAHRVRFEIICVELLDFIKNLKARPPADHHEDFMKSAKII